MIDFDDPNTVPESVTSLIYEYFERYVDEILKKISGESLSDIAIRCAIEEYAAPFKATHEVMKLYRNVHEELSVHKVICFHATRLLHPEKLLESGLRMNNITEVLGRLSDNLSELGYSSDTIGKIQQLVRKQYNVTYRDIPRLCFFAPYSMIEQGGYDKFCTNLGGELVQRATEEKYPEILKHLSEIGESMVVEFRLEFDKFLIWDTVIYRMIRWLFSKQFLNYSYTLEVDSLCRVNIPPEDIIRLIPYTVKPYDMI